MRKTDVHTHFDTAFKKKKKISAAVSGKPNHITSLMSVYGYMWRKKKNSTHKSPGYHFLFKLKIRKMSGFNSETARVTFDLMSINACEKQVLLPAFYLKQHDIGPEVLPMQSLPLSCIQLLLIYWKIAHKDFMYSIAGKTIKDERKLNNSDISNAPVLYDRWKLLNLSPHHSSVVCSDFCTLKFCAYSSHSRSLSHATTWVLWIAFLSVR